MNNLWAIATKDSLLQSDEIENSERKNSMIQGNLTALIMFVAVSPIAITGGLILKLSDPITMTCVGFALILADCFYRWRSHPREGWLMEKEYGGHIFFFPVWVAGILIVVLNILVGLGLISV